MKTPNLVQLFTLLKEACFANEQDTCGICGTYMNNHVMLNKGMRSMSL